MAEEQQEEQVEEVTLTEEDLSVIAELESDDTEQEIIESTEMD